MNQLVQLTEHALGYAEAAMKAGNLSAVDLLVQGVLGADRGNARGLNLLNALRSRLRLRIENGAWVQEGAAPGPRYMLIKAWGYGYWADVCHVMGALLVCEMTGRIPVIHWGSNSRFRGSGGDAFRLHFKPVSTATIEDVTAAADGGIFPAKWTPRNLALEDLGKWDGPASRMGAIWFLNRPEPVVVSDFYIGLVDLVAWIPPGHPMHGKSLHALHTYLAGRYLKPVDEVTGRIDAFRNAHFTGRDVLAVHIRGSDKANETGTIDQVNAQTVALMDAESAETTLFVLTEDANQLAAMQARYGDRVISTVSQRATGTVNLPFQRDEQVDRVALGHEVMVDTYLAMACDRFIGNGRSNVSNIVALFRAWEPGTCRILEPLLLLERNFSVYLPEAELRV